MFTKNSFSTREELVKFVNSKSLTERRLFAKEHNLVDGKSETIADYAVNSEAVFLAPMPTVEETTASENVSVEQPETVESVDVAPQPTNETEVTTVDEVTSNVPSDEQLAKVAKHYKALVTMLDTKLDTLRGASLKIAVLDGLTINTVMCSLRPSEMSTFNIDFSSLAPNALSDEETVKRIFNFDTRKMALDSYDSGAFKLDGIPLTKEMVELALTAKVTPYEKQQKLIDELVASPEYVAMLQVYMDARQALANKIASIGAELHTTYIVVNPIQKGKAKGNSTATSTASAATRTNVHKTDRVVVSGLDIWRKAGNGKMHLTTNTNNEWTIEVMDNAGTVLTTFDQTKGISPSKATVLGYQKLTTPNSNVSSNKFWEVESLYIA